MYSCWDNALCIVMSKVPPNHEIWPWPKLTCPEIWIIQENMQTIVLICSQVYLNQSFNNCLLKVYFIICVALATVILQNCVHINQNINTNKHKSVKLSNLNQKWLHLCWDIHHMLRYSQYIDTTHISNN